MAQNQWPEMAAAADLVGRMPKKLPDFYGCVYAVEWGDHIKIGRSGNPRERLKSLLGQAKHYSGLSLGRAYVSRPHTNFLDNETALHHHFASERTGGELFAVGLDQAQEAIQHLDLQDDPQPGHARSDALLHGMRQMMAGGAPATTSESASAPPDAFSFFLQIAKGRM